MHAEGVGCSDVGRTRDHNEDSFFTDDVLGLFVVADGMGGHASGEVASALAIEVVRAHMAATMRSLRQGQDVSLVDAAREAVEQACATIYDQAIEEPEHAGMGCTLTMLQVHGTRAVLAHVGDTRLYLCRQGKVSQLTHDHTMAQELVRAGVLSLEESKTHRYAHVLTRAVGTHASVQVDTLELDVLDGDRYLICSDGLSEYIDSDEFLVRFMQTGELDEVTEELCAYANASGGVDNVTAVAVQINADEASADIIDEMSSEVLGRFDVLGSVFLFEGMSMALLTRVVNACTIEEVDPGKTIIEQGQRFSRLFVVLSGRASISHDGADDGVLGPGDHAGATSLLHPRKARATMAAEVPLRLLVLDREPFWDLIRARPWLGVDLLERLGRKLSMDLDHSIEVRDDGDPETTKVKPRERL